VASDIGEGPAAAARRTVTGAGLETAISVRVGDGLDPVSPDEVDDIVIAGMGGETIAEILAAAWDESTVQLAWDQTSAYENSCINSMEAARQGAENWSIEVFNPYNEDY
jgi:hypothetical protein